MSAGRWRCFVAVPLGERLRADLADAVTGWRQRPDLAELRWADAASWHVTLAFLGSIDPEDLDRVISAVTEATTSHEPMRLATGGLGAFPSPGRARVAWYGVADPDRRLRSLAADLADRLGLDPADRFRAHVTLARARREPIDLRAWLAEAATSAPEGELTVDHVQLMRSHLGGGPARYETLATTKLGVQIDG